MPLALPNVACVRPSSRARLVISSANAFSLPAMPSARMMQESLPLETARPRSRSSTLIWLFSAANIVELPAGAPPVRQANSLTLYSSVSLIVPFLSSLKTTSAVISFCMLDGAISWSAFFSNSTLPLSASIRMADGASISKPPCPFLPAPPWTLLLAAGAPVMQAATRPSIAVAATSVRARLEPFEILPPRQSFRVRMTTIPMSRFYQFAQLRTTKTRVAAVRNSSYRSTLGAIIGDSCMRIIIARSGR